MEQKTNQKKTSQPDKSHKQMNNQPKINYQKELDKRIENLQKKEKSQPCFSTAAALHAAVMYWNI